jgi:hypothetical protein
LGKISIQHVASEKQLADIATKSQPTDLFVVQREAILQWQAEHKLAEELQPQFNCVDATFWGPAEWSNLNSLMSTNGQPALRLGLVPTIELKSWPASYWTGTRDTKTASQATISEEKICETANGHEPS